MIAYKLCRKKNDKYYPLYVNSNDEFIIGERYEARPGEITKNGKVKSKLGELSYRPGVHLSEIPMADHIGTKDENGKLLRRKDNVWLKCYVSDDVDYTPLANMTSRKCLRDIPDNGFYFFNTNSQAKTRWIIASWIIPIKEISRAEEISLCHKAGYEAQRLA